VSHKPPIITFSYTLQHSKCHILHITSDKIWYSATIIHVLMVHYQNWYNLIF